MFGKSIKNGVILVEDPQELSDRICGEGNYRWRLLCPLITSFRNEFKQ